MGLYEGLLEPPNRRISRALTPEATRYQYMQGVSDPSLVSPDGSTLDDFYLARPGAHKVQIGLFTDYGSNVGYIPNSRNTSACTSPRSSRSGEATTPTFCPPVQKPFDAIYPAVVHLFDTGHFALETHSEEIVIAINDFLTRELCADTPIGE